MKWRKLHELNPWDERTIFRLQQGAAMRGDHSPDEWKTILSAHRQPPPAPQLHVVLTPETIALDPEVPVSQLELGAVAHALSYWSISNARKVFDPGLPFRLRPLIGADAFTKPNSWRRRIYEQPLILARADQRYPLGWDGLHEALVADIDRFYFTSEIKQMGERAIAATLSGPEANDFWRANR